MLFSGARGMLLQLLLLMLASRRCQAQQQQQLSNNSAGEQLLLLPGMNAGTAMPATATSQSSAWAAIASGSNLNAPTTTAGAIKTQKGQVLTAADVAANKLKPATATAGVTAAAILNPVTTAASEAIHIDSMTYAAIPIKTKRIAPTATAATTTIMPAIATAVDNNTNLNLNMQLREATTATTATLLKARPTIKNHNKTNWQTVMPTITAATTTAATAAAATTAASIAAPTQQQHENATSATSPTIESKTLPTLRLLGSANMAQPMDDSLTTAWLSNAQATAATGTGMGTGTGTTTAAAAGWPVKHAAVLEGDVILGGLMMVHSREDSITCGPIMPQGGIQALEAMLYTLDQVNQQQLLPNVTLGAHLLDDCDKDTYGLEMAVDFIKGKCSLP
ncbi:hypothetical protein AWZ03_003151 [Drosophila navojoa]|uniref:Receptor ligand binding region domain-containing protein n=1 Tax=Drosophila navojoa TaxID=7232 RepID=A0A484BQR4_DRONA|nr:hypothetical protein AWZ03_003151 [Drosophila navojoa]